jgi:hypothetical protein
MGPLNRERQKGLNAMYAKSGRDVRDVHAKGVGSRAEREQNRAEVLLHLIDVPHFPHERGG